MKWHVKAHSMLLFCLILLEYELLRVQDLFRVAVLNDNPKGLSSSVISAVPCE